MTHQTMDQIQGKNLSKGSAEQELLGKYPGQHVIFVRYADPGPHLEWIYNPADIDCRPGESGRTIWAKRKTSSCAGIMQDDPFGFSNLMSR